MEEEVLVIETTREVYDASYLNEPMTIGELIEILSMYDENQKVCFSNDNGYTYGNIYEENFREKTISFAD